MEADLRHNQFSNERWCNHVKLLTIYTVWSLRFSVLVTCLNNRTKSLNVSQVISVGHSAFEELRWLNLFRICSKSSFKVKHSTQFTKACGSWKPEPKQSKQKHIKFLLIVPDHLHHSTPAALHHPGPQDPPGQYKWHNHSVAGKANRKRQLGTEAELLRKEAQHFFPRHCTLAVSTFCYQRPELLLLPLLGSGNSVL